MECHEAVVNGIKNAIEGLTILSYAIDCGDSGCENCSGYMSKTMRINGEITHCILRLPGLLKSEIDKCLE